MEKAVERMDRRCQTEMLDLSLENMGQEEIELTSGGWNGGEGQIESEELGVNVEMELREMEAEQMDKSRARATGAEVYEEKKWN